MKTQVTWLLIACLVPCLTGCEGLSDHTLTGRLWDSDVGGGVHGPARPPNLKLFETADQKDVLVRYEEEDDKDGAIKLRAFFLHANEKRLEAGKKPGFVSADRVAGMTPIPVFPYSVAATNTATGAMYAILTPDGRHFTFVSSGQETGTYYLPVYRSFLSIHRKAMLTPLTVTADVVIYSAAAAAIAGLIYVSCLASNPN